MREIFREKLIGNRRTERDFRGLNRQKEPIQIQNQGGSLEKERKESRGRGLSFEETVIQGYTGAGNLLKTLEKNPRLLKEGIKGKNAIILKALESLEIIRIGRNRNVVKEIDWKKFQELQPHSTEGRILKFLDGKFEQGNPFLMLSQIAEGLKVSGNVIGNIITSLEKEGSIRSVLLNLRKCNKIYFSGKYSEEPPSRDELVKRFKKESKPFQSEKVPVIKNRILELLQSPSLDRNKIFEELKKDYPSKLISVAISSLKRDGKVEVVKTFKDGKEKITIRYPKGELAEDEGEK